MARFLMVFLPLGPRRAGGPAGTIQKQDVVFQESPPIPFQIGAHVFSRIPAGTVFTEVRAQGTKNNRPG